jgi:starvation-inducible DNA-binding protein
MNAQNPHSQKQSSKQQGRTRPADRQQDERQQSGTAGEATAQQPGMNTEASGPGVDIGLDEQALTRVVEGLQRLLSDEVLLYLKTRNFHWNVEGPDFSELHKLFETQYEELDSIMDEVAERIRIVGGYAAGSMAEFRQLTSLQEVAGGACNQFRMEELLLRDHEQLARRMRKFADECGEAEDLGTQDFVTGVMQAHEKMAWMLRSFMRRPAGTRGAAQGTGLAGHA